MKIFKNITRLLYICYIFLKHGLDELLPRSIFSSIIKVTKYLIIFRSNKNKNTPIGQRVRKAIEELGPIFVKFGQIASTRLDIIPPEISKEIVKLQEKVQPFDGKIAVKIIEQQFNKNIDDIFAGFDTTPLASASIAQVHAATLKDGSKVVVKILRPNIDKRIALDVAMFEFFAKLAERYSNWAKRFKASDMVEECKAYIFNELDLMREAANASLLRRNFSNSPILTVPKIFWEYTKNKILVMERMYGIEISNIAELRNKNVNLKLLAERGVEIFFTQVFRDCFFHADMHPGNIRVNIDNPQDPKIIALDFGIVGTLSKNDQNYLADNFLAFLNRDYRKVAELHVKSGWVPANTRVDEFESAIRTVCEPMFERSLANISFGEILMRLFNTARQFNMNIQPQLILLQKTLISIEGLGRQIYPELDLWQTSKPILEKWMKKQIGIKSIIKKLRSNAPEWLEKLPEIPNEILSAINNIKSIPQYSYDNNTSFNSTLQKSMSKNNLIIAVTTFSLGIIFGIAIFKLL